MTRSSRWPLLIDPQGQALAWIKRREERNSLRVTQLSDKRFRNQLEDAMAFGQPLLLENVEETIDPLLDPRPVSAPFQLPQLLCPTRRFQDPSPSLPSPIG